jgi:hypothetical protein
MTHPQGFFISFRLTVTESALPSIVIVFRLRTR